MTDRENLFLRTRRYDTKTLDLFTSQLPAATGARPHPDTATSTESARLGTATESFVRWRSGSLLGFAFSANWFTEKGSSIVGKSVSSPTDLATLASVLHDPRAEIFCTFWSKKAGSSISTAVSYRMYNSTDAFIGDPGEFMAQRTAKIENSGKQRQ